MQFKGLLSIGIGFSILYHINSMIKTISYSLYEPNVACVISDHGPLAAILKPKKVTLLLMNIDLLASSFRIAVRGVHMDGLGINGLKTKVLYKML